MVNGVGNRSSQEAFESLSNMTSGVPPISESEFRSRLQRLQKSLQDSGASAAYLHAGTNLYYFTGLKWNPSERMVAAIVPASGDIRYIAPNFELDTLHDYWTIEAPIDSWHEHECPYQLLGNVLKQMGIESGRVLLDEATPYFTAYGISQANSGIQFELAQPITQSIRSRKSAAEIAIIQRAHEMTLEVIKAAASMLRPGIETTEVAEFIERAHRKTGADAGSYFCIVLFGVATSFPHGVKDPQTLKENDYVLIDTGCELEGYKSDITRCFPFGDYDDEYQSAWAAEKRAQLAAFEAAKLGQPCEAPDYAARASLVESGFGPDYQLPGLPHRTGHGCGLEIHEGPNLVRGEKTAMDVGMVFSDEPMLVVPDKFGVRLEDHLYMTDDGAKWFTEPSHSIDDPFGIDG